MVLARRPGRQVAGLAAGALLEFRSNGATVSRLSLFLLVSLFGLSMDHHVLVVSRVREAILLDATVVRAVLLPSAMVLLGERNWWLPRLLRWLPASSSHA